MILDSYLFEKHKTVKVDNQNKMFFCWYENKFNLICLLTSITLINHIILVIAQVYMIAGSPNLSLHSCSISFRSFSIKPSAILLLTLSISVSLSLLRKPVCTRSKKILIKTCFERFMPIYWWFLVKDLYLVYTASKLNTDALSATFFALINTIRDAFVISIHSKLMSKISNYFQVLW